MAVGISGERPASGSSAVTAKPLQDSDIEQNIQTPAGLITKIHPLGGKRRLPFFKMAEDQALLALEAGPIVEYLMFRPHTL